MAPGRIIAFIRRAAGVKGVNRNFNVEVNGAKYKFLPNARVQKTIGTKRTIRNWATFPNKTKVAKAFLPVNVHANWNALPNKNKYNALLAYSSTNNNFVKELENMMNQ
jgi:hypothetical protein